MGYIGTYTNRASEGLYRFEYMDGVIKNVDLFARLANPKYLCFAEDMIAVVCDFESGSGIALFDSDGNMLSHLVYESVTPAYIAYRDGYLYTANYHEGSFCVVELDLDNKSLSLVNKTLIKDKAGAHQVLFYRDKFLVPCLLLDKLVIIDSNYEIEYEIEFESGAGPRHGVFLKDGHHLYVIGELSNILYTVDLKKREITAAVNVLEGGESHVKDSAAIRACGDYIYVSTRSKDVISVLKFNDATNLLELVQVKSAMGKHPRDFIIIAENLLVANRDSDNVVLLGLKAGLIDDVKMECQLPEGVAIIVKESCYE